MPFYFRHERVRPAQKELMDDMYAAMAGEGIFMANAPTGMGKTDAALSAALTRALEEKLTVFFLTPKISQHRIAMDVVNGIAKRHSLPIRAVDIVGRSHCCIDDSLRELDHESFMSSCEKKRKNRECMFHENARGSTRGGGQAKADAHFRVMLESYGSGKAHNELIPLAREHQACPYEWLMKLAGGADVIIADYHHMMVPFIRDIFLAKTRKKLEESIIIIDEAHNLASRVRGSLSRGVNTMTFRRMEKEMRFLGLDAGPIEDEFSTWGASLLADRRETTVSAGDFDGVIGRFGITLEEAVNRLEEAGVAFVEKTNRKSACLRLSRFFSWWGEGDAECVRILQGKNAFFHLSKKLLDPSSSTRMLNECASAVLMSGSLLPMEMHRDVLGLDKERTLMKSYQSPFDVGSIVNVISENLTTRYAKRDAENYAAIAMKLDAIIDATPGGTAIFFPSYTVMKGILPIVLSKNLIVQEPGMKPEEIRKMLRDFRHHGGVLVGVQGGSLSEGVDYCDGEIKTVVIVGVALEEMGLETRALIDHYDKKFGRGWDYGYLYPGTIKALQAAGRARRKEGDRAAVVYLDERFAWSKYGWILNANEEIVITDSPERKVAEFWKGENALRDEVRSEKA